MTIRLRLRAYGETAVPAGVEGEDYESRWATTQVLAAALRQAGRPWLVDLAATYDHLYVSFEPELLVPGHLGASVSAAAGGGAPQADG